MYSQIVNYNGIKVLVFCTPKTTDWGLYTRARARYELYKSGKITIDELTGKETKDE